MNKNNRVFLFIDGGYFYRGSKRLGKNGNFDIVEVCNKIAGIKRKVVGICYYVGEIDEHMGETEKSKLYFRNLRVKQQKFLLRMKEKGIGIKLGYFNKGGNTEKSVDMLLACDMIEKAMDNIYDVGIVVTGDGDFHPAIDLIQRRIDKKILNGAFKGYFSRILMDKTDGFFFIDNKF